jgi:glycerol kinase
MSYILALDQGTTSSRAILFDREGKIISTAQKEFRQIFPKPGWVEHNPNEIWSSQSEVVTEAMNRANIGARDIHAVGITNQRETTIVWDKATGDPICNAIVWQDRRTASMCDRLKSEGLAETFQQKTGLVLDAYFSGTKIAWILNNVDGAREKAERGELAFGTVDTWLASNLTSGEKHITDVSNASRTLLYNIHTKEWDDELLNILNIPRNMMPEVCSSSDVYCELSSPLFSSNVPLAGIAGDQQAATMGQVCVEKGMAKNTYGTGCFLLMNTGTDANASENKLLTTVAWERDGTLTYALEGSVFIGGAIIQWLRDGLGIIKSSPEVEALAQSVDDNGGVYLVPALAGLGAPHWDPYARGTIVGITRGTTSAHIARAALEGIAYQVADLVSAMEADSGEKMMELRVDGGAAANNLLMQFQADVLGVPVVRPENLETTALGAAYMAGLATDFWKSIDEIETIMKIDRTFEPQMPESEAKELRERWSAAVQRSLQWEVKEQS